MTERDIDALAQRLAAAACIADIETGAVPQTDKQGRCWYDMRPMLDPREVCDDTLEMNRQSLDYALGRGLISAHPLLPHLVRIVRDVA